MSWKTYPRKKLLNPVNNFARNQNLEFWIITFLADFLKTKLHNLQTGPNIGKKIICFTIYMYDL